MKRTAIWIVVLDVVVSFMVVVGNSAQVGGDSDDSVIIVVGDSGPVVADRIDDSDVLSIDCGATENYSDKKIKYEADEAMLMQGETRIVSWDYSKEQIGKQLSTLRSFPDPNAKRNCYTLRPNQGKDTYYLVRAYFGYGNYDNRNKFPSFDLQIGPNYWAKVDQGKGATYIGRNEAIYASPIDDIHVCFAKTGEGVPFVSLLEVWPLKNSRYTQTGSSLLTLIQRSNLGASENDHATYIRYQDDIYGRSWLNEKMDNSAPINSSTTIDSNTAENTYRLPKEVLGTAVQASPLIINLEKDNSYDYYVYLHFYEFQQNQSPNQQRKLDIGFSDGINVSLTLGYLKPTTVVRNIKKRNSVDRISITSTSDSPLPAMLNAYEIYRVVPVNSTTDEGDVSAIQDIKRFYSIRKISWQGDPCMPNDYTWEGLTCNYGSSTPRITKLNLGSSKLKGEIAPSIINLTKLESLDMKKNQLTGKIPEWLTGLPNLNYLDLTHNNLKGRVPKALKDRADGKRLDLRVDKKNLQDDSKRNKIIVGVTVGVAGSTAVSITIAIPLTKILKRRRRENKTGASANNDDKADVKVSKSNNGGTGGPSTSDAAETETNIEL